jgi:hypothetical protein
LPISHSGRHPASGVAARNSSECAVTGRPGKAVWGSRGLHGERGAPRPDRVRRGRRS